MASPLDVLQNQAAGVNVCSPAVRPAAVAPTPVIVQQNPLTCYSDCAVPPTPASVQLKPSLGVTCDTLQVCVTNTSATPTMLVIGAGCFFDGTDNPGATFSRFLDITGGLIPANAAGVGAISCDNGILAGTGAGVPTVRSLNCVFDDVPVAVQGWVEKVAPLTDASDIASQLSNPLTQFEINPFNGAFDICTNTMEPAVCGPCINGSVDNVTTFNEPCVSYIDSLHGVALQINGGVRVTLQACYVGIADVNNYRSCSVPGYNTQGVPAY